MNVQSFEAYEPPVAKEQTNNEHKEMQAAQIAKHINHFTGTLQMTNKVTSKANAPQQHPDSSDCGSIVCYLMDRISRNKEIDPNLLRENCMRYKAKIVVKLLTDKPRS
ncbi:hypothetical protein RHGRI_014987 [Rhododendron griersonianum]|uniref:Ubiquitin-like protease family profile domain-containing protein n=1 Tax=Rhododendron griersonianum TaxID=479676 RepID=A0AAV6KC30_9ERIC|nr:hypothetical protein RHGRI_014987 [Rhododendron griersonianum]